MFLLYYLFILGEIAKNFFILLTVLFVSSQSLVAGYIATYSLNVSNPGAYVEAMDDLMESDWENLFPLLLIYQYVFNGYDDATHVVVLNYEDTESLGKGTDVLPVFQKF